MKSQKLNQNWNQSELNSLKVWTLKLEVKNHIIWSVEEFSILEEKSY